MIVSRINTFIASAAVLVAAVTVRADAAEVSDATCKVFPGFSDEASMTVSCGINQDQGLITIRRADGVIHDLRPAGDKPGLYMDQNGGSAYGRPLPDGPGFLFRFAGESVEIRWAE